MIDRTLFQFCQKIVLFSEDEKKVLLCKRFNEKDYDGIYSFIGGKMETTDKSFIEGLKREKNEEIGSGCNIIIYPQLSTQEYFQKNNGLYSILPHYYAIYKNGVINLNNEYSDYKWININKLKEFEPKIKSIERVVSDMVKIKDTIKKFSPIEI